jgi:hypothetical protein
MRYLKTFLITAPIFAVFYHFITINNPNPIKWWPDSAIMGGFLGIVATVVVARFRIMFGPNLRRRVKGLVRRTPAPPVT